MTPQVPPDEKNALANAPPTTRFRGTNLTAASLQRIHERMPTDLEERESLMRRLIIQSDRALQAYLMTNPAAITDPAVEARMRVIELASPYLQKRRAALEAYRAAHLPQCHPSTTTGSTAASTCVRCSTTSRSYSISSGSTATNTTNTKNRTFSCFSCTTTTSVVITI